MYVINTILKTDYLYIFFLGIQSYLLHLTLTSSTHLVLTFQISPSSEKTIEIDLYLMTSLCWQSLTICSGMQGAGRW
jgi:hypothetical protein